MPLQHWPKVCRIQDAGIPVVVVVCCCCLEGVRGVKEVRRCCTGLLYCIVFIYYILLLFLCAGYVDGT